MATKLIAKPVAAKKVSKKAGAVKRGAKAAVAMTSDEFKAKAKLAEAWMGAVIAAETGITVKGSNSQQALGQGALAFKVKGERQVTGGNQLKGNFGALDGNHAAEATAALTGSDYPLDSTFTRQGVVRIKLLAEGKLCADPRDQKMVEAIYSAIRARYPEADNAKPAATRQRNGNHREVANPNPIFA